ncbi:ATP-grasp domain-containing protein [Conexibacter woesei]|uniref:ATP-grasp domain-containing protein n=1 Tax=Conexibacter woesei (strain DSM 14684 / CCUG 47730 / CIP 108061 / JCM 11494 / NBRC 100937 / ID131577) TaxID=469383 RepID=D3FEN8_CONWI|nr:hypothetical protein [Conexibacter woesei]ADB49712.1 conserved hypothetical protein [Conexibacter woesei DSM 14684]
MTAARIAFVTCADLLVLDPDDELLADAVRRLGSDVVPCAWDDGEVDWAGFDLVLVRSPWDYHLRRDAFVHWAQRVGRTATLRNRSETIVWNTDKSYLRALAEQGVPTVPTQWLERGAAADLSALLAERGWREAIVKPSIGLGSSGLLRVHDGDADGSGGAHLATLLAEGDAMVQPFIPSVPAVGELSLVFFAGELSHSVRKRPPAGEFRVQPEFGAVAVAEQPTAAQLGVAHAALATLADPPLYARVDLVAGDGDAQWLMELELVEPTLYFEAAHGAAERLARMLVETAGGAPTSAVSSADATTTARYSPSLSPIVY